jgi:hypothetical protein
MQEEIDDFSITSELLQVEAEVAVEDFKHDDDTSDDSNFDYNEEVVQEQENNFEMKVFEEPEANKDYSEDLIEIASSKRKRKPVVPFVGQLLKKQIRLKKPVKDDAHLSKHISNEDINKVSMHVHKRKSHPSKKMRI